MARLRDREPERPPAGSSPGLRPFLLREHQRRLSFSQWLKEPGARSALAVTGGFFLLVYAACFCTALVLGSLAGASSLLGICGLAAFMFLLILIGWALLSLGPVLLTREGGLFDALVGMVWTRPGKPLELDEGPALLARRRGDLEEALRLYRQHLADLPHRLDLQYRIAEIEHRDRKDRVAAVRGYREFLRGLEGAGRSPSRHEEELAVLARASLRDLERAGTEDPRRVIKV